MSTRTQHERQTEENVTSVTHKLVVLSQNLHRTLTEVEGEGSLVGTEVVDVEDEGVVEVGFGSPDGPSDSGVGQAVSVNQNNKQLSVQGTTSWRSSRGREEEEE